MTKTDPTHKFADILKFFEKCMAVIQSCRTHAHIHSAKNMINNFFQLFPKSKTHSLALYHKKRREVIVHYGSTLEGTTVMVVTNEDEPIEKGVVIKFDDFDKPHQNYLPIVRFERDDKEYLCMGVLLPFDEKLRDELMQIQYMDRWKRAAEIAKQNSSDEFMGFLTS